MQQQQQLLTLTHVPYWQAGSHAEASAALQLLCSGNAPRWPAW
jgi:hypothetical protein